MKSLRSIETTFKTMRTLMFASFGIIGLTVLAGFYMYKTALDKIKDEIFVITNDGSITIAHKSSSVQAEEIEKRDHILMFHERFFNLDNNEQQIENTLSRASYLGDGKQVRYAYKEKNYYNNLMSRNMIQRVYKDSILIDGQGRGRFIGHLEIQGSTSRGVKRLVTEFNVRTGLERVENNPHGMFIDNFKIIEENLIETFNQ
jgi:conjugative transposon TraK protein